MSDIEILEEFLKHYKEVQEKYKDDEIQAEIERSCYFEEVPAEAIENLIQENKELKEYKKIAELTKISCCTTQNCEALNNAIREGIIINKAIDYIGIDKETEECCGIFDVNGIELLKILRGEK